MRYRRRDAGRRVHGDHLQASGGTFGDVPSDVAKDPSLLFGEGDEPISGGVMECRNLPAIVVFPVSVIVREDLRTHQVWQVTFEERGNASMVRSIREGRSGSWKSRMST